MGEGAADAEAAAAAAAAAVAAARGLSDGSPEQARAVAEAREEAAAVVQAEEEEVWMAVFGSPLTEDEFFESFSADDATAMRVLQPENLKLLACEALSNISRFMEARHTSPQPHTVHASIRVLTRVFPALLADPDLRSWCWERRRFPPPEHEGEPAPAPAAGGGDGEPATTLPHPTQQPRGDDERVPSPGSPGLGDGGGGGDGVDRRPYGTDGEGGGGGGVGKGAYKEERGGDGDGDDVEDDFPVCFASVALHAVTNLLCFPGFCVDDEAAEWDDYYTPIPELHYGIREASIVWAPGVAVSEHNMRQVSNFDSNRVEVLRLLAALLSLPLFLETPSTTSPTPTPPPPPSSSAIPGVPLSNPTAALAVSRHLHFSSELFYSLLNLAVVRRALSGGEIGVAGGAEGTGLMRWLGLGGGGGAGDGSRGGMHPGLEGGPQSLTEWALQLLALLLRHGRPYEELLVERGVDLRASNTAPVFGSVPREVEFSAEKANGYNCFRRCVFVVHSDDDLGAIALGLLRHMDDVRLRRTRPQQSVLSIHQETLMIFSAFVHENPRFVPRLAASEELVRGTAVCVCHFLELAVASAVGEAERQQRIEQRRQQQQQQRQQQHQEEEEEDGGDAEELTDEGGGGGAGHEEHRRGDPLGEEVGVLVLLSRLLLVLSENERFMAMLVDMPAGGGTGRRGAEFSAPEMEEVPGTTLIEVLLALAAWTLARAGRAGAIAAPALAAVARNACPYLTAGMGRQTAEWLLDALEVYLQGAPGGGGEGSEDIRHAEVLSEQGEGLPSSSWAVASLLLEGMAAAAAFHHEEQADLVMAMLDRSKQDPAAVRSYPESRTLSHATAAGGGGGGSGSGRGGGGGGGGGGDGVLRWLAARGGMLEGDASHSGSLCTGCWRGGPSPGNPATEASLLALEHSWFASYVDSAPWEGWAMRRVLWPLLSLLMSPLPLPSVEAAREDGAAPGGGGGVDMGEDEALGSPEQQERAAAVRALAAFARRSILRPSGLCPPWDADGDGDGDGDHEDDGGDGLSSTREQEGKTAQGRDARRPSPVRKHHSPTKQQQQQQQGYVRRGTAAIAGALGYFSSARSPPGAKVSAVGASGAGEARQQGSGPSSGSGAAVSDVELIEQGGGDPGPSSPEPPSAVAPQKRCAVLGEQAVLGGDGDGGVGGGTPAEGRAEVITRVVALEEPWQSIYLWSLLFVKTTLDLRLFDSRTIRLFDVLEEESEDGSAGPAGDEAHASAYRENDDEIGTEVDEDNYQESFFPPEDSHSGSEEEPGGFLYGGGGGRGSGGAGVGGGVGGDAAVPAAESFQGDDGRADSLV
eukprot:g10475.t1